MSDSNRVIIGRIGRVYGVQGWLRINSYTNPIDNILNYPEWQIAHGGQWQTVTIESNKRHGEEIIVKLLGVNDREQARLYTNNDIAINRDNLPKTEAGEYYWHDLIGLSVINQADQPLGKVDSLIDTGANDILVVTGKKRVLIPYLKTVILEVNLQQKTIRVDWDEDY